MKLLLLLFCSCVTLPIPEEVQRRVWASGKLHSCLNEAHGVMMLQRACFTESKEFCKSIGMELDCGQDNL